MPQQHARLTVVLCRELRTEGITNFVLYAPGEYHGQKFVLLVMQRDYALVTCVLCDLHIAAHFCVCVADEKDLKKYTQKTQQAESV